MVAFELQSTALQRTALVTQRSKACKALPIPPDFKGALKVRLAALRTYKLPPNRPPPLPLAITRLHSLNGNLFQFCITCVFQIKGFPRIHSKSICILNPPLSAIYLDSLWNSDLMVSLSVIRFNSDPFIDADARNCRRAEDGKTIWKQL